MKLISEKMSISDLLQLKKHEMLKVNPEYQRAAVWSDSQQKKLIDSVMRGYPLPLIYLHHRINMIANMRSEGLEIIDGQQRINALYKFGESGLKLFDPVKDDKAAKFPSFIKNSPCPWSGLDFLGLSEDLRNHFLDTEIFIIKITTDVDDEARDLFIRLQAGLPLNAQEKRDAWPGGFTELVLRFGGKSEIARYPGHDFFRKLVKRNSIDRGDIRQLCAQICMLYFEKASQGNWIDIGTQQVDDYYYRNLGFNINDPQVARLSKVLDHAVRLYASQTAPKLQGYEAIHIVLLLDSLRDEYETSWESRFMTAYDSFKEQTAVAKKARDGEYWFEYGSLTQTQSAQARTIQRRHAFFTEKMLANLQPKLLDQTRLFGKVEREIVYYRDRKRCAVCGAEIRWEDLEIHHVEEHQIGGQTVIENAVAVHADHHPKGQKAIEFHAQWLASRVSVSTQPLTGNPQTLPLNKQLPPSETKCRFTYFEIENSGQIVEGQIVLDTIAETFNSFSAASRAVSGTSRNGWLDWEILLPDSDYWILADSWRTSRNGVDKG